MVMMSKIREIRIKYYYIKDLYHSESLLYKTNSFILLLCVVLLLSMTACTGCGNGLTTNDESRRAKELLQGVWMDEATESVIWEIQGDSVFYPDSTSVPAYFKVLGDSLYIGSTARYYIEKQTEHLLWFRNASNELIQLVKCNDNDPRPSVTHTDSKIQSLKEVVKRDSVILYGGERYHLYWAINPTKYKVVRQTLNDEGLNVDNVFYDNIIHLSIYHGAISLFSQDFRKTSYEKQVPSQYLSTVILNDMVLTKVDSDGFHLNLSLCSPGDASCFLIEHVVSFDGQLTTKLLEY